MDITSLISGHPDGKSQVFKTCVVFEINAIHCYSCFFQLYPQNLGLSCDSIYALVKLEPCQERFVLVSECSACNESI